MRIKVEAWKYGPVVPTLYHRTKEFGSSQITDQLPAPTGDVLDQDADGLMDAVMDNYGHLSGPAISNLTHRAGSPWSQIWREGSTHLEIPVPLIRAHYEKLKDADRVTAA